MDRKTFKLRYLQLANHISNWSYCNRLKVGAVIVDNDRVISMGYNGTLPGYPNECEENNITTDYVLHAEQNALLQALKYGVSVNNSDMYCTHKPCVQCMKLIIAAGIKNIYYIKDYNNNNIYHNINLSQHDI